VTQNTNKEKVMRNSIWIMVLLCLVTRLFAFAGGDGTEGNPWQITTPEELSSVRNHLGSSNQDKHFIMINDIELTGTTYENWVPIGMPSYGFTGTFDGNNFIVSGMKISSASESNYGLFGTAEFATIKNLGVVDFDIHISYNEGHISHVGGLLGKAYEHMTIDNCFAQGNIYAEARSTGGLIGYLGYRDHTISNSYADVTIKTENMVSTFVAGFIGDLAAMSDAVFNNCYAYSDITLNNVSSSIYAGGFASTGSDAEFNNCFVKGSLNAENEGTLYLGGFIGVLSGNMTNCFAIVDLNGTSTNTDPEYESHAGGLVGNALSSNITSSYTAGHIEVTAPDLNIGGLTGSHTNDGVTTNSYWNVNLAGVSQSASGTSITTVDMQTQSSFENWDFASVWNIDSDKNLGFPYLEDTSYDIELVSNPVDAGTFTGAESVFFGDNAIVTTTQNTSYQFLNWANENGEEISTETSLSFVARSRNKFTANFEEIVITPREVVVLSTYDEWGTVSGGGIFNPGDEVTITATPAEGYHFEFWNESGVWTSDEAVYTFTMPDNDLRFVAMFEEGVANDIVEAFEVNIRNYPNPFNPHTTFYYSLEKAGNVSIKIFNIKGQEIKSLVDNQKQLGDHSVTWNGKDKNGDNVNSGIYFYNLQIDGKTALTKKCTLLK
jgi:hypothetical protein